MCPRGYRPVKMPDGNVVLMKHEELYPEKIMCECGVRVSAVDRRALVRHQSTKGHLEWASKRYRAGASKRPCPCMCMHLARCYHRDFLTPSPYSRRMNQFKVEFVGTPLEEGGSDPAREVAAALGENTIETEEKPPSESECTADTSANPVDSILGAVSARAPTLFDEPSRPNSSVGDRRDFPADNSPPPGDPPSSWELAAQQGPRWTVVPTAMASNGFLDPEHTPIMCKENPSDAPCSLYAPADGVAQRDRPPPLPGSQTRMWPSLSADPTVPSVADVVAHAPTSFLPSADELESIASAYGTFGY